jgi:amidase
MVAVAHGNDMGGSIRVPASNCGLVGLKPTRARTSLGPEFGEYWGPLTHQHVLTRTVRDTAGVLDAIAGAGVGDPYTAPLPARSWSAEVATEPGRLRVGYRTALPDGTQPDPEVVTAVESTARLLEALGHDVAHAALDALDDPALGEAIPIAFSSWIAGDMERWGHRLGRTIAARNPAGMESPDGRRLG